MGIYLSCGNPEGGSVEFRCNSTALYDFIEPHVKALDEMDAPELQRGKSVYQWVGIGNASSPIELYRTQDKEAQGYY